MGGKAITRERLAGRAVTLGSLTPEEGAPLSSPPTPLLSSTLLSLPFPPFSFFFIFTGIPAFYDPPLLGLPSWLHEPGLADLNQCHSCGRW